MINEILGLHVVDWAVVAVYVAGVTSLGLYANRNLHTSGDYFLGGRRFGRLRMAAQAFGSGTRTDQAVVVIGASAQIGIAGIWYQWIYLFATPFYWLIAPVYRRLRYVTIGDFFEQRYGAGMGAAYAVMGLAYFAASIGLILKGTGVTIEAVTQGAVSTEAAVIGITLFFLAYGIFGGWLAIGMTHSVQGLFILILSFLLIPFALQRAGGLDGIQSVLPDTVDWFSLVADDEVTLAFIAAAVVNGLVGVVVQPHHMAMNGSGKDEIACRLGWTGGTFMKRFATLGWAITGVFIAALLPDVVEADVASRELVFGAAVVRLLPTGLVGLMLAAMVAAVVAACQAFMIGGSALFTRNFYERYVRPEAGDRHCLSVARLSALVVVVSGVMLALYVPTVVAGLLLLWKITAFLGIAFWAAVCWRRANRYGAWASLVITASATAATSALGWSFPAQVALYLPAGVLGMILVSLLTRPEAATRLDTFYSLLHAPAERERQDKASSRGHSLMLVNLLSLHRNFSAARYRVDLQGFTTSWGLVGVHLILAAVIAYFCSAA